MQVMLENGVIPIVNENDTVSIEELMFTDNDELSGLIAQMMNAQTLVLLSNVDGIYNGDPANQGSEVIRSIKPGEDLSSYIQSGKSSALTDPGIISTSDISAKKARTLPRVNDAARSTKIPRLHR